MKEFFKYVFATITGIVVINIIGFVLLIGIMTAIVSGSKSDSLIKIKDPTVLIINLKGDIPERISQSQSISDFFNNETSITIDEILLAIKKAKTHPNILGIHLNINTPSLGYASTEEIRNALIDFKKSNKFITAYADHYQLKEYYLASLADKLYVNPEGIIQWSGLAATPVFYTNLLKNIGVEMQVFKVGTYKSAVEPYTQQKMSEASKTQVKEFLSDIWGHVVEGVSESRNIAISHLNNLADQNITFKRGDFYVQENLADSTIYKADLTDVLKKSTENEDIKFISTKDMCNVYTPVNKEAKTIAIYYAIGDIVDSNSGYNNDLMINAPKVIKDLKKLEKDESIKAVVIRVNSPGGSAFGSEQIWKAIQDLKAKKTVIVSMGDYAASGGYYISAASDYIIAEPTTLTGSIGIFGMIPNIEKLTNKIGVTFDVVKTNDLADFGSINRPFSPKECAILQEYIDGGYELFVKRCADGRKMTIDQIKEIAEGRVWTGIKALNLGLIDELGGINRAIELAAERAGIEHIRIRKYPSNANFIDSFWSGSIINSTQSLLLPKDVKAVIDNTNILKEYTNQSIIQARIPYTIYYH